MRTGKSTRQLMFIGTMMAAAALLAACGTSTGPSAASSSGSGSGAASSQVAKAQAFIKTYESTPTSMPITTPLKAKPPTAKTLVYLQCDVSQCADISKGLQAATAVVGWTLKVVDYQSANPATLIAGLQQALQYKPAAVIVTGIPSAAWSGELAAYQQAGVPIIEGYTTDKVSGDIVANIGGYPNSYLNGQIIANWVIADSGGRANIVSYQVPDFPILAAFDSGFADTISKDCPSCSITPIKATIAQALGGQGPSQVVSALQSNPSANYVVTDDAPWIDGLPSALSAANLHVKVVGQSGDTAAETAVKSGQEDAFTGLATVPGAWSMLDAALRHVEGLPMDPKEGLLPTELLTNKVSFTVSDSFDEPSNYAQLFKALWKL